MVDHFSISLATTLLQRSNERYKSIITLINTDPIPEAAKPPAWAQGGDILLLCLSLHPLAHPPPNQTQRNIKIKLNMALRRLAGQLGLSTQVQVAFSRAFASGACAGLPGA